MAGCGDDAAGPEAATVAPVTGAITVLAAASLTEAFEELGTAFREANPRTEVTFSFGASSALVAQIVRQVLLLVPQHH